MNCSQLYLGTDIQVPVHESELFTVEQEPSGTSECKKIKKILNTKHVYYLAPHTGCGCGWDFLDIGEPTDDKSRQSCEQLAIFLTDLQNRGIVAKIYSVCLKSVGLTPSCKEQISTIDFIKNISEYRVRFASSEAKVYQLST